MTVMLSPVLSRVSERRRCWILATVAAGQFMLVVDAFIVNVAILTTTQQIANGVGVAQLGTIYFSVQAASSDRTAVLAALAAVGLTGLATAALLQHMRIAAASAATFK
ncbi:MAG: hypothetical protein ACRECP_01930 [Methylocella sp.]